MGHGRLFSALTPILVVGGLALASGPVGCTPGGSASFKPKTMPVPRSSGELQQLEALGQRVRFVSRSLRDHRDPRIRQQARSQAMSFSHILDLGREASASGRTGDLPSLLKRGHVTYRQLLSLGAMDLDVDRQIEELDERVERLREIGATPEEVLGPASRLGAARMALDQGDVGTAVATARTGITEARELHKRIAARLRVQSAVQQFRDEREARKREKIEAIELRASADRAYDEGDYAAAVEHYEAALEALGASDEIEAKLEDARAQRAAELVVEGDRHNELFEYDEAVEAYREARELRPHDHVIQDKLWNATERAKSKAVQDEEEFRRERLQGMDPNLPPADG